MLHEEQDYVLKIARELGINTTLIHHKRPTISCAEKLDLLKESEKYKDWTLERIVKALYFSRNHLPFIGVITPEFEKNIKPKEIFPKILGISNGKAERYLVNPNRVPKDMSWGTCTPFPLTSSFGKEISDLVFINYESIRHSLVDISVGGCGKEAYEYSMHIPYIGIYEILKRQFPERVHMFT